MVEATIQQTQSLRKKEETPNVSMQGNTKMMWGEEIQIKNML